MRINHIVCSLILTATLVALRMVPVFGQGSKGLDGVHTEKTATADGKTGTIKLETYVEGEVVEVERSVPADIVLVLDFSESMGNNIEQLKTSCNTFLSAIRNNNKEHRVAIVSYNRFLKTQTGQPYSYDGTVVWPQKYVENVTTLQGYNPFGAKPDGYENKIGISRNQNEALSNYVRNDLHSFFVPVGDKLPNTSDFVLNKIIDSFSSSDCWYSTSTHDGYEGNFTRGLQIAYELLWGIDNSADDYSWYNKNKTDWGWICRGDDKYIDNSSDNGVKPTFVVVFTDGAPGYETTNLQFNDSEQSICFALNSIGEANRLKSNNTSIFTIGLNSVCNPDSRVDIGRYNGREQPTTYNNGWNYYFQDPANAFNCFLHLVSSNYSGNSAQTKSDIERNGDKYWNYIENRFLIWDKRESTASSSFSFDPAHYLSAADPSGLVAAFEATSRTIIDAIPAMDLTEETVVKDFIDAKYFQLPESAKMGNGFKLYTKACTGLESGTFLFGGEPVAIPYSIVFDPSDGPDPSGVVMHIGTDERGNDYAFVSGYNYADEDNIVYVDSNHIAHGREFVIEIPFEIKEGVDVAGTLQTNTPDSGIYQPGQDDPLKPYPVPSIVYWEMTISRTGLRKGESAHFVVERIDEEIGDYMVYKVVLTGVSDAGTTVSKVLSGVTMIESGVMIQYKVTETGWAWSYYNPDNPQTKAYDKDNKELKFEFTGGHSEMLYDPGKPAYKLNHGETITTISYTMQ